MMSNASTYLRRTLSKRIMGAFLRHCCVAQQTKDFCAEGRICYYSNRYTEWELYDQMNAMTGVILAGGENSRFPTIKSYIKINGERIIDRNLKMLKECFEEIFISTNSPEHYFYTMVPLIGDVINTRGPISGILSCLLHSRYEDIFVMACDMPFVKKALIKLITSYSSEYDAVVPMFNSEAQPLLAVYNKRIIPVIEKLIRENKKSLKKVLENIHVKYIDEGEINLIDRDGRSFININTVKDLKNIDLQCEIEV